jgi:hypothetical protein
VSAWSGIFCELELKLTRCCADNQIEMDGEIQSEGMRADPRYGCAGDAEIVVPGRGLRYAGKIGDLSLRGCFIEVGCRLERGTCVEVWMNARGQPLRVAANLMVQKNSGVGLKFLGVPARKEEQIKSLIAELAEEAEARKAAEAEYAAGCEVGDGLGEADSEIHLVETLKQGLEEQLLESEVGAEDEASEGNLWQRWTRRLEAWLNR